MTQRLESLDFIKGLAIYLVIFGHVLQEFHHFPAMSFFANPIYEAIYTFHMPLFAAISGYLFGLSSDKYSVWQIVKSRIHSLLLPGFLWGTILYFAFRNGFTQFSLRSCVGNVVYGYWFLATLFACTLVALSVRLPRLFHRNPAQYVTTMTCCLLVASLVFTSKQSKGGLLSFLLPFFVVGYWYTQSSIKRYWEKINAIQGKKALLYRCVLWIVVLLAWLLCMRYYTTETYIYVEKYSLWTENALEGLRQDLIRFFSGLTGIVLVALSVQWCYAYLPSWLKKIMVHVGKKSLGVYLVHMLLFECLEYRFSTLSYFRIFGISVLMLGVSWAIVALLERFRLTRRFLLGSR